MCKDVARDPDDEESRCDNVAQPFDKYTSSCQEMNKGMDTPATVLKV